MERETIESPRCPTPGIALMERAAEAVAETAEGMCRESGARRVLVLCGGGSNGGDGLAAARLIHRRGIGVRVRLLADPASLTGDAAANYGSLPVPCQTGFEPEEPGDRSGLVVDALFGTGLSRDVTGETARAIGWMNGQRAPVLSVDIPSGIDALTGAVRGCAVRAAATVTFGCPKRGCLLYPGREHAGRLIVCDIGIPEEFVRTSCVCWEASDAAARLPARPPDSHKGNYGHVAVVAGSEGMMGAGALCSAAAMRAGAGLATWIHPRDAAASPPWEVMTRPIAGRDGALCETSAGAVLRVLEGKTVLAMGPGLGRAEGTGEMARRIVSETRLPLVLDADGIAAMAGHLGALRARGLLCLTPHPGELSRLIGIPAADIAANPMGHAGRTAADLKAVVLLKGAATVIADPGGELAVNATGNAGMATGGSGDALTGLIAGLAAQGTGLFEAAAMGAWIHGRAGDLAAAELGMRPMTASDILRFLPAAIKELEGADMP